ncbi:cell division protein FtsA [Emticicia sp. BO119]|uniref:cell division protein FtsA n=1 Tax=Emticicia sp. BO119 TaxID=2757768 RepID=UPI0015F06DD1|nr:cell division protein FtsA [Emticicia sp. BO119]MBA4852926.1 cell division protein FtsA [Emticicia sp. BO119]
MSKGVIVGIDIGSTKICAVAGIMDEVGKVKILDIVEEPTQRGRVSNGTVVNLEFTAKDIDRILNILSDKAEINIHNVIVNISGENVEGKAHQSFLTRDDSRSTIRKEEIERLAVDIRKSFRPTAGNIIIHTFPQEFIVDRAIVPDNPVGRFGITLGGNFFLISTPNDPHLALRRTIESVGVKVQNNHRFVPLRIVHTLFTPLADAMAVLSEIDKKLGVAVVNIGGDTTEIAIFQESGLRHISVIPFAGKSITNDLVKAFQILPDHAEKLKLIMGAIPPDEVGKNDIIKIPGVEGLPDKEIVAQNVSIIIEERVKELASMVMAEIMHSGYDGQLISGVVLTGGTSNIAMIKEVFTKVTNGMNIRVGNTIRNIGQTAVSKITDPKYATVVGLVLSGFMPLDERVPEEVIWGDVPESQVSMGNYNNGYDTPNNRVNGKKEEPPQEEEQNGGGIFGWFKKKVSSAGKIDMGDDKNYTN